ncbi:MAG: homocysteine S-methyltransferase family protein, partial [Candidatus Saccharibacteria bacterium]
RIMILDGAMGTMLQQRGLKPGECPEMMCIKHPEVLEEVHRLYVEAGSDIIQTNTFGGNRFKLAEYGLADRVAEINAKAVEAAKRAAGNKALVALSVGPTGRLLKPVGDVDFDDLYDAFAEQVTAAAKAGADLISIETMTDIGELRAALIAAKQCTSLPVIAHLTFEDDGRTMMGTDPVTAALIIEALGAVAVGANCSGGAKKLLPLIAQMAETTNLFVTVEPNAGLPKLIDGNTVFPESPEEMAGYALELREAGANIIGGCCGTTPLHIKAMADAVKGKAPVARAPQNKWAFCSRTRNIVVSEEAYPVYIGERINPTARKKLAEDIREGRMEMVVDEARKQVEAGAPMLDVNMGVPGIDQPAAMKKAVVDIQSAVDSPVSIDSTDPAAIEEGLKNFVGRALINSTTGEEKALNAILPLAKKYGAAVLGLCLDEKGIPDTAEGRFAIAERIYAKAKEYGLRDQDIYIDCLVKTASAEQAQVMETIKALQMVKTRLGVRTVLGVSNVSHGLPARDILNSTYLAIAWSQGLDLPIINPFDERMREITKAAAVLMNRDPYAAQFIDSYKDRTATVVVEKKGEAKPEPAKKEEASDINGRIREAVIKGQKNQIVGLVKEALEAQQEAIQIVNTSLIPAIEEVGELYDRKVYFLPQLMLSAETMKEGFGYLKPLMATGSEQNQGTVLMATVEGDIHDIGKNIVCIMLENYGYRVVDLGKDVPADRIIEAAERDNADIIGLSALMTTTMPRMNEVIELAKKRNLKARIVVGGAVLTQDYADKIGAAGYSPDARQAVVCIRNLLGK